MGREVPGRLLFGYLRLPSFTYHFARGGTTRARQVVDEPDAH